MTVTTIAVPDMHCAACISKVRRAMNKLRMTLRAPSRP